jgi:hypothetical protein
LVPACSGCYAARGRYLFGSVRAVREHNMQDWQRPEWANEMVTALQGETFFRWFDSGDVYHPDLAGKILLVMLRTPNTRHWLPTRARKNPAIAPILARMAELPNVVVRHSSDSVDGDYGDVAEFGTRSVIVSTPDQVAAHRGVGKVVCHATTDGTGQCGPCRACWSPKVATIAYAKHGGDVPAAARERLLAQRAATV